MERDQYLTAIERETAAFVAACARAGLDAPVPACPDWDVADLTWHVGEVFEFWRSVVEHAWTSPDEYAEPDRPPTADLPAYVVDQAARLVDVLRAADPSTRVWTWADQQDVAFVVRRMAQEVAVHRWDAEQAASPGGPVPAIDAELASDGIDEFLTHFLCAGRVVPPIPGSVHLHCTDVAGEWTARPVDGARPAVTREHAKGDAAMRGSASDLLLALWRRVPLSSVDVIGDADVAAGFVAASRLE